MGIGPHVLWGKGQTGIAAKGGNTLIATDPLSLVFIFCFLLGFGFFLAVGLMGGHGHAHAGHLHLHLPGVHHVPAHVGGHTPAHAPTHAPGAQTSTGSQQGTQNGSQQTHFSLSGYVNPTTIALFLLGFGFFGYFFHNTTNLAVSVTLILASGGGLIIAALILLVLNRIFANAEGSTELDVVDRTGMLGKVSITIPEKGIGEIIYTSPSGIHKSIPARGFEGQRLERDQEVVVVNYQNGVAEVDTWEHFMHEGNHDFSPSTLDELAQLRSLLNESDSSEIEIVMRQEQQKE
jgi:hypothetical protein